MSFSDADLKRLKVSIQADLTGQVPGLCLYDLTKRLTALLARLEAAEAFGELAYQRLAIGAQNSDAYDLYDAWRSAAGKGEK